MDRLPGASVLARALLALTRAHATGVLEVVAGSRLGRLAIREGHTVAAAVSKPDEVCLGDLLVRAGTLDPARHRIALDAGEPQGPVGVWLVREGLVSQDPSLESVKDTEVIALIAYLQSLGKKTSQQGVASSSR